MIIQALYKKISFLENDCNKNEKIKNRIYNMANVINSSKAKINDIKNIISVIINKMN